MSRDFLDYIAIAITIALLGFVNLYAAWNFATWLARQMPRLRVWLRPYPDDAQLQAQMLAMVKWKLRHKRMRNYVNSIQGPSEADVLEGLFAQLRNKAAAEAIIRRNA